MASHGCRGLSRIMLGGQMAEIAANSPISVVVVK
ncbi:hypothetical protein [Neorhizobium petrolearium]